MFVKVLKIVSKNVQLIVAKDTKCIRRVVLDASGIALGRQPREPLIGLEANVDGAAAEDNESALILHPLSSLSLLEK